MTTPLPLRVTMASEALLHESNRPQEREKARMGGGVELGIMNFKQVRMSLEDQVLLHTGEAAVSSLA